MKINHYLGVVFIILQIVLIIYAKFIPEKFFCWAPYDEHTYYEISIKIKGVDLTKNEIGKRYNYKPIGWEPRAIHNVFNIITQYENTYGLHEDAEITVLYSTNGHKKRLWTLNH